MGELVNRGESAIVPEVFYKQVSSILNAARDKAYTAVNFTMVEAYWEIGKSIVDEQGGEERAAYGEALIAGLSRRLTADFGRGFGLPPIPLRGAQHLPPGHRAASTGAGNNHPKGYADICRGRQGKRRTSVCLAASNGCGTQVHHGFCRTSL